MRAVVALFAIAACGGSSSSSSSTVRVAAAADLARAFEELGKSFQQKTGIQPIFTFGSSGLLAKQIEQGAPFDLYASASRDYAQRTVVNGKCGDMRPYARGRLVVWTPKGTAAPKQLAELADPKWKRIAIANPEHAPYGLAAKQALAKAGVWDKLEGRMVLGENVQAALQYAQTHNADAAVIALSLAVVNDGGAFLPIDPTMHDPLDQELVMCGHGATADRARQLADFINSPDGREIMTRYGFLLPNEQMK